MAAIRPAQQDPEHFRLPGCERTASGWRAAWRAGASLWALSWLGFLLVGRVFATPSGKLVRDQLPSTSWPAYIFNEFDSGHFLRIAVHGYFTTDHGIPNWDEAFLPGYPAASRFVAAAVGGGRLTPVAAFVGMSIVAWLGALASAVLMIRLVQATDGSTEDAAWSAGVLLFGPYGVFLVASYSESLFLALALGAWLAGRRSNWWWAALLAAAAALVRVNGLFLLAGLAVMAVADARGTTRQCLLRVAVLAVALAAPVGYVYFLHRNSGSWFTWLDAQRGGWGRGTTLPWASFWNSCSKLWGPAATVAERYQSAMELVFAILMVAGGWILFKLQHWPELTYVGLTAVSLLTSTVYLSIPRSVLLCFPLLVLTGQWLRRSLATPGSDERALARLVIGGGVALAAVNTGTFVSQQWTG